MGQSLGELSWDAEERYSEDGEQLEYRQWTDEDTRVVSGPIGAFSMFHGRRFYSRSQARAFWAERADIVEEYIVEGRWVLRIKRGALRLPLPEVEDDMARTKIDPRQFVKEWTLAGNLDELATRLDLKRPQLHNYASKLRKLGVNLKPLRAPDAWRGQNVNVAELNALIEAA